MFNTAYCSMGAHYEKCMSSSMNSTRTMASHSLHQILTNAEMRPIDLLAPASTFRYD